MDYSVRGVFFDGQSSQRREVEVRLASRLEILEDDVVIAVWPYDHLRKLDAVPGSLRLRSTDAPELANLTITDKLAGDLIAARAKKLTFDGVGHQSSTLRIVALSMAASASLIAVALFGVPLMADAVAKVVPVWAERKLGVAVANQVKVMFGNETCSTPEGTKALAKLSGRLTSAHLKDHVSIEVLKTEIPNAIALPGGQIFLFSGLLDKAEQTDEIAGVLAHELGHEAHRDSLRGMIQAGGSAFLLGLLFGDVTGSSALILVFRQVIDSAHSREAETDADDYSRTMMHQLGRPAAPMALLLQRIDPSAKERGNIFASHPLTAERLKKLSAADSALKDGARGPDLLSNEEWRALKAICGKK